MAPFPTATIPEMSVVTDHTVTTSTVTVFTAQEHPSYFPGSTNPLAFYAMWPGENVGADSPPSTRTIAARTVEYLGALGAWSQGNAFPETFPAAVRAGVDPLVVLGNMTQVINVSMPRNILGREGQECAGAVQAVNDMLLSSYSGMIRLYTGWPQTEPASFTTLRAKGGFVVSAAISAVGVVSDVSLSSDAGTSVVLVSPWPGLGVVVTDGKGTRVHVTQPPASHGVYTWNTTVRGGYTIAKDRTSAPMSKR